jgi:hypothetical protein
VLSEKEIDEQLEFEMDDEDLEWLTIKLPEQKVQLKEDKFEQIIDRLEKESFKQVARVMYIDIDVINVIYIIYHIIYKIDVDIYTVLIPGT